VSQKSSAGSLAIALNAPGMTPLLKAGVGGLAASLRAINKKTGQRWESGVRVSLGDGSATVEETKITIEWPNGGPESTLRFLWEESFRLSNGVIYLPGAHPCAFDRRDERPLRFQSGLKSTFLQHGRTTTTSGGKGIVRFDIDSEEMRFHYQPYSAFAHQSKITDIVESVRTGSSVDLPGWAYPGAAQRHVAHKETMADYTPSAAIAALFSLVGCISLPNELGKGGFLIIPEPTNLVKFASTLPYLLPSKHIDTAPASLGDAVLLAEFYCLINGIYAECISSVHGVLMKSMAWDKKQKYRASLVNTIDKSIASYNIECYSAMRKYLPPKYVSSQDEDDNETWIRPSHLRAFASDNLVRGRPWYDGFSTYSWLDGKETRYLHTYKALEPTERSGLIEMVDKLHEQERLVVQTMHQAIGSHLGKVHEDYEALGGDLKKRFRDEMQRIRLAFSNAKTQGLVIKAFADLWSKAGRLGAMQEHWEEVTSFITGPKWMLARDLALIGLASYKGKDRDASGGEEDAD